jgi:hypothetical protein
MYFNGFTLLLMILSGLGGVMLGVRIEMAHRANQADQWLNGNTIEQQMKRDGWTL